MGKQQQQRNGPASATTSVHTSGSSTNWQHHPNNSRDRSRSTATHTDSSPSRPEQHGLVRENRPVRRQQEGAAGEQERAEPHPHPEQRRRVGLASQPPALLKISYTNARSIQNKINELAAYSATSKPDIILICESWCNDSTQNSSLSIPDYQLETDLRLDRHDTGNGLGGGLLVYSKIGIKILTCDKFKLNAFNQFCAFTLRTSSVMLTVILAYRPPTSNIDNLVQLCSLVQNMKENTILIGDLNLPSIDWQLGTSDTKGRRLLDVVEDCGHSQLVNFPTHNKGNCLDLVITNCSDKIISVYDDGVLGNSDHCIIGLDLNVYYKFPTKKRSPNWNKVKTEVIRKSLSEVDWHRKLVGPSTEGDWQKFKNILSVTVKNMFLFQHQDHPINQNC